MGTRAMVAGLWAIVLGLGGCGHRDGAPAEERAEHASEKSRTTESSFVFGTGSVRAESRVARSVALDGSESLHGVTEVRLGGEPHPMVLTEHAEIDASGRLVAASAELRAESRAATLVRSVRLDASRGLVTVNDKRGERLILAAADHPWVYESLFQDVSLVMGSATPVQAWVARRAAQAGSKVRVIDVSSQRAYVTLADQVVVDDAAKKLVILGDEVIEVDSDFVRSLPWKALEEAAAAERQSAASCEPGPV